MSLVKYKVLYHWSDTSSLTWWNLDSSLFHWREQLCVFAADPSREQKVVAAKTLKCIMVTSTDDRWGRLPYSRIVILFDTQVLKFTCQSEDGRIGQWPWHRFSSDSSKYLESRTFNLIWIYLHKSPLNLNVPNAYITVRTRATKLCTDGPGTGIKEISIYHEIECVCVCGERVEGRGRDLYRDEKRRRA